MALVHKMTDCNEQYDMDQLEQLIDNYGLSYLLDMLATVCCHKAEHILASYGDVELSDQWEIAASNIRSADK